METNQLYISGEWPLEEIRAMGERLADFCPSQYRDEDGEIVRSKWADDIKISAGTLGYYLVGTREARAKNIKIIVEWMLRAGFSYENVVWWLTGKGKQPKRK